MVVVSLVSIGPLNFVVVIDIECVRSGPDQSLLVLEVFRVADPFPYVLWEDRQGACNLIKEGLGRWLPTFVAATNRRLGPAHGKPLTLREVEKYYADDARMWGLLQVMRRADRYWQRKVRRRPYQFLLPGKIVRHV